MVVYKTKLLYAGGTFDGTEQDNVAEITVDRDSDLIAFMISVDYNATASGNQCTIDISTNPNYQGASNATVGSLAVLGDRRVLNTNGSNQTCVNMFLAFPEPVHFLAGEKIYCNVWGTNTVGYNVRCLCYFKESGAGTRSQISR